MCKIPTENYTNLKQDKLAFFKNIKKPVTKFLALKSTSPRPVSQIISYNEINKFGFNKRLFLKGKIEFRGVSVTYENQSEQALK